MNKLLKEKIKRGSTVVVVAIALVAALVIMLIYNNEGEKNMPFNVSKIFILSSAETQDKPENPENLKWNVNINQYNNFYITFEKNENYKKNAMIKNIIIENIEVSNPKVGTVELYMPNPVEGKEFSYEDHLKIDGSLTYNGAVTDNNKALNVGNQGGTVLFRAVNKGIAEYVSNEDNEIKHDGSLLSMNNISVEDVTFTISFDIVIVTNNNSFRGRVTQEVPSSDLIEKGVSNILITDCSNIVFKRD